MELTTMMVAQVSINQKMAGKVAEYICPSSQT
ncbi:hypothetical protein CCACVL1_21606 [Corchorus capsularis]|uniref:Uncharacterized protein n=1 Tax=Corchorus capsularis TaxID=210143 RepID=A0A1R3H3C1_COCAP|nr:hypothetical protein CCACVL1_21606 [Corchorus capsularis]